jgi:hypothetical protein
LAKIFLLLAFLHVWFHHLAIILRFRLGTEFLCTLLLLHVSVVVEHLKDLWLFYLLIVQVEAQHFGQANSKQIKKPQILQMLHHNRHMQQQESAQEFSAQPEPQYNGQVVKPDMQKRQQEEYLRQSQRRLKC